MKRAGFLFILILTTGVLVSSCKDEIDQTNCCDYTVFGIFFGECVGENCVETYKLINDELLEDNVDSYPRGGEFLEGTFTKRSEADFDYVRNRFPVIPDTLLLDQREVIGIPDGGDWGGVYLAIKEGSVERSWLIDLNKSNISPVYHELVDSLYSIVTELK